MRRHKCPYKTSDVQIFEGKGFSKGVAPYEQGTFQTTEGNKHKTVKVGRNLWLEKAVRKHKCPYQNF